MKGLVKEDAYVLVPNKEHQNFTRTDIIIPAGNMVEGEEKKVNGNRRGEPFTYKLFYTTENQYIHLNKIKPMATTQVYLGADAQTTPTVVDVPQRKLFNTTNIIGGVLGAFAGVYYSKKFNKGNRNLYAVGGAIAGFLTVRYLVGKRAILVAKSK
jgi:uncharacterized protein YcfJ